MTVGAVERMARWGVLALAAVVLPASAATLPAVGTELLPGLVYGCRSATPEALNRYKRIASAPFVRQGRAMLVEVDAPALRRAIGDALEIGKSGELALRLFDADPLRVSSGRMTSSRKSVGWSTTASSVPVQKTTDGWTLGNVPIVFTIADDHRIRASIDLPGAPLRIEPVGGRCHAIYEIETSALPPDHPPSEEPQPLPLACPSPSAAPTLCPMIPNRDPGLNVVVRVAVAFTDEAADAAESTASEAGVGEVLTDDALQWIRQTNDYLDASGVRARLELARAGRAGISEAARAQAHPAADGNPSRLAWHPAGMLPARAPVTNAPEPLTCWWNRSGANVLILIVRFKEDDQGDAPVEACGRSMVPRGCSTREGLCALMRDPANAPGTFGYAWVRQACANRTFAFAHEIGHLLGADHETATAQSLQSENRPPVKLVEPEGVLDLGYAFATNPAAPAQGHVTLMGSRPLTQRRVAIYSTTSDRAKSPLQDATVWGSPLHDNAKIMEAMAFHLAQRSPPPCPPRLP